MQKRVTEKKSDAESCTLKCDKFPLTLLLWFHNVKVKQAIENVECHFTYPIATLILCDKMNCLKIRTLCQVHYYTSRRMIILWQKKYKSII